MATHYVPSIDDAALRLRNLHVTLSSPRHGWDCRPCWESERTAEDAALAYDLAVSIGRRWSAPSWLEPVAW